MTPDAWDGKTPLPLVLVTHGYGVGGLAQVIFMNLQPLVNEKNIILVAPDGLIDSAGYRYWNAVDTCCDFDHRGNDDVAYLTGIVAEIAKRYPLDAIFLETRGASFPFPTAHPFEAERDEYERELLLAGCGVGRALVL